MREPRIGRRNFATIIQAITREIEFHEEIRRKSEPRCKISDFILEVPENALNFIIAIDRKV